MSAPAKVQSTLWRNLIGFLLAGAALAVAFGVQSPYMAFSLYAFLLLLTLAHFSSLAWVSGLESVRTISRDTLQQGEEVDVELTVTNRHGWPIPWIYIEDQHPPDFPRRGENARLAVLMPGRSITVRYTLTCPRRGYHRVGPVLIESGDLFGLQKRFRTGGQQNYVAVLPTVAYIETFTIAAKRPQGPVRISNRIYEDPTRISGLREYVPGDPLNRIHWKVSARTGQLYVKQNEPSSVLGATLVLDLHDESYSPENKDGRMELAITTAASLGYLLQMAGEQVGMLTNARDAAEAARYEIATATAVSRGDADATVEDDPDTGRLSPLSVPTRRSPIQAMRIIENLARVMPGTGLDASQLILTQHARLPRDAALLPIVPQVSGTLALTLAEMKYAGFAVTVFLVGNRDGHAEAVRLLAPYNIDVLLIEHERDLHEINPARIGQ